MIFKLSINDLNNLIMIAIKIKVIHKIYYI